MDDLKTSSLVTPNSRSMPLVSRLPLLFSILEHNVGRFKDPYWERM
jgi:hypothetical protein